MAGIDTQTAEQLLAQRNWLLNLAKRLVRDEARADDLCQETLLQALARPLRAAQQRSWLARAVRSLGARQARDEQRRRRREVATARPVEQPATAEVVEKLSTHRIVVNAVMKLAEPYRTTVLLRYWEDLPPRAVAQRLGVPVETVRTRLKRGLTLLRTQLDREFGGRRAWLAPVAALQRLATTAPGATSGASFAQAKVVAFAAMSVLTAGLLWIWHPWSPGATTRPMVAGASPVTSRSRATLAAEHESPDMQRRTAIVTNDSAPSDRATARLRGRVLGVDARPLAGIAVRVQTNSGATGARRSPWRTDENGVFVLERPTTAGEVVTDEAGIATVLAGVLPPGSMAEPVVVAAPAVRVRGVVLAADGAPLPGAQVTCALPRDFRSRFADVLDFSRPPTWTVHCSDEGQFRLPELGRVPGSTLLFSMAGFLPVARPLPTAGDEFLRIELQRPQLADGRLLGQVLDWCGAPAPGAQVSLGDATTVADDEGRFTFDARVALGHREIIAMKRGSLPGQVELGEPPQTTLVTVRLGGQPPSISGRLLTSDGEPIVGAKVWALDPTVFGALPDGLGLIAVEGYLSGGLTKAELLRRFTRDGRPVMSIDRILDENPTAKWSWVKTDARGGFRVDGLLHRPYTLAALQPDTLARTTGGPFYAGSTNVVLTLRPDALIPVVAGRVVSASGAPVRDVCVELASDTLHLYRVTDDRSGRRLVHGSGRSQTGRTTITDADGRFRFEHVGTDHVYLRFSGDEIMPDSLARPAEGPRPPGERTGLATLGQPLDDLHKQVSLRLHLRVEFADTDAADRIGALDRDGRPVHMCMIRGPGIDSLDRFELHDGRSQVLSASENVTTLVLFKGGRETRRIPVALRPGIVNVIRD